MIFYLQMLATTLTRGVGLVFALILLQVSAAATNTQFSARRWRLFLIPEEIDPPQVIKDLQAGLEERTRQKGQPEGFIGAAIDADANAIHVGLLRGKIARSAKAKARNTSLHEKALREGPQNLTPFERAHLLGDAESMAALDRDLRQINLASQPSLVEAQQGAIPLGAKAPQETEPDDQTTREADLSAEAEAHWQTP